MTLVALVRGDEFDVFTRPERIPAAVAEVETKAADTLLKPNADPAASTLVQSPTVRLVQYG